MAITETRPEAAEPSTVPAPPAGPAAWLTSGDHKVLGTLHLVVGLVFFLTTGVLAVVLRTQLAAADLHLVAPHAYQQLLTLHGTFAFFLFLLPAWVGLATAVVPLQIGSSRLAFPRLAGLSLW